MTRADDLDELFGEGSGQPEPRTRLVKLLLITGLLATVGGLACTTTPGGILVLLSWAVIEKEVDRVDSGYFPVADKPHLLALQRMVHGGLVAVIVLFILQGMLFCNGFYEWWWPQLWHWISTGESPLVSPHAPVL